MKRQETLRKLYSLKGAVNETEMARFKTDLFANGLANVLNLTGTHAAALILSGINTLGISITGATMSAICVSGNAVDGFKTMTGTFTNGINLGGAGITNAINIADASTVTNLFKFNELAGCIVDLDVDPIYAASSGGLGADASIVIDIAGSDWYIPIFMTSLS